jgi:hypothetical protein
VGLGVGRGVGRTVGAGAVVGACVRIGARVGTGIVANIVGIGDGDGDAVAARDGVSVSPAAACSRGGPLSASTAPTSTTRPRIAKMTGCDVALALRRAAARTFSGPEAGAAAGIERGGAGSSIARVGDG